MDSAVTGLLAGLLLRRGSMSVKGRKQPRAGARMTWLHQDEGASHGRLNDRTAYPLKQGQADRPETSTEAP